MVFSAVIEDFIFTCIITTTVLVRFRGAKQITHEI